jgi:hypothetical protein
MYNYVLGFILNEISPYLQDLLSRLLANRLSGQCNHLTVTANQNPRHIELLELLLHYWVVIDSIEQNKLPEPLRALIRQPQDMMVHAT